MTNHNNKGKGQQGQGDQSRNDKNQQQQAAASATISGSRVVRANVAAKATKSELPGHLREVEEPRSG